MGRLVLIPGFQDTEDAWGAVMQRLDVPGWQPTPITLREVDANPDVRGRVLEGYRDQVMATLEDLEPTGPVVVLGHSMGAQIAELMAIALADRTAALALITPIPLKGFELTSDQKTNFAASARQRTPESAAKGRKALLVNVSKEVVAQLVESTLGPRRPVSRRRSCGPGGEAIPSATDPHRSAHRCSSSAATTTSSARR